MPWPSPQNWSDLREPFYLNSKVVVALALRLGSTNAVILLAVSMSYEAGRFCALTIARTLCLM